jgi:hypothetical protein
MPHFVIDTPRKGPGPWELGEPGTTGDGAARSPPATHRDDRPQIWLQLAGPRPRSTPDDEDGALAGDAFL